MRKRVNIRNAKVINMLEMNAYTKTVPAIRYTNAKTANKFPSTRFGVKSDQIHLWPCAFVEMNQKHAADLMQLHTDKKLAGCFQGMQGRYGIRSMMR